MSREKFELELQGIIFNVDLDLKGRKNINLRIKPNNLIRVSKPRSISKTQLVKYLKDQESWILERSDHVNLLNEERLGLDNDQELVVFGKRYNRNEILDDSLDLSQILFDYIESQRMHYDELYNVEPLITVKNMKGKWGMCIPKKNHLVFNQKLVHYPKDVIDYVILHEYCHFKVQNHSKDFYDLIKKEMPNYKQAVKYLKEH